MPDKILNARLQHKRDIKSKWELDNPILLDAEMGIETDTGFFKIGDGITPWNSLKYNPISISQIKDLQETLDDLYDSLPDEIPSNIVLYVDPTEQTEEVPNVDADMLGGLTTEEVLSRSNHTGTQGIDTIDGLIDILDSKAGIGLVTEEVAGLMSAIDKIKLDNVDEELDEKVPMERKINNKPLSDDIDLTAVDVGAAKASTFASIIIPSGAWTGAGPYYATAPVDGVPANGDGVKVALSASATDAEYEAAAAAKMWVTETGWAANTISLVARGDKPGIDLPVSVEIGG